MIAPIGTTAVPGTQGFPGSVPTVTSIRAELTGAPTTAAAVGGMNDLAPTVYLDSALRIRSVNRVFEERFGLSHGVLEGRNFLTADGARWNHPELHALLARITATSGAAGQGECCTILQQEDGTELHISARRLYGGIFEGYGRASGYGLICLTLEEKTLTDVRRSTSPDLLGSAADEFLASLSLEMRQALQVVAGAIVLLLRAGDPQVKADVHTLNAQMPRLHRICADLDRYAAWRRDGNTTGTLTSSLTEA